MNVLAIDTSGPVCGVAVLRDGTIVFEEAVVNKKTHSANLLPLVDAALSRSGLQLKDMQRLAVVTGPGSFTGVRIGVCTVKGLSHGSGIPCVAVDALQAIAASIPFFDGILCPMQDARAGQVYGAAFLSGETPHRILPDAPASLESFLDALRPLGNRFCFLGDGMPVHRERVMACLGKKAVFPPPNATFLRPSSVAMLGAQPGAKELDYLALMPYYLRPPQAERNRALKEIMQHVRV